MSETPSSLLRIEVSLAVMQKSEVSRSLGCCLRAGIVRAMVRAFNTPCDRNTSVRLCVKTAANAATDIKAATDLESCNWVETWGEKRRGKKHPLSLMY